MLTREDIINKLRACSWGHAYEGKLMMLVERILTSKVERPFDNQMVIV